MKSCNCYALRAIDCTCLPKKYDEIYTTPDQEPVAWMEMVVANLVREGVNKHKARELAQHFYTHPPQRTEQEPVNFEKLAALGWQAMECNICGGGAMGYPQRTEPVIDKSAAIRIATALGWTPPKENT